MNIPDRVITLLEFRRSSGERGTRKRIAYRGIVYDVTNLRRQKPIRIPTQCLTPKPQ